MAEDEHAEVGEEKGADPVHCASCFGASPPDDEDAYADADAGGDTCDTLLAQLHVAVAHQVDALSGVQQALAASRAHAAAYELAFRDEERAKDAALLRAAGAEAELRDYEAFARERADSVNGVVRRQQEQLEAARAQADVWRASVDRAAARATRAEDAAQVAAAALRSCQDAQVDAVQMWDAERAALLARIAALEVPVVEDADASGQADGTLHAPRHHDHDQDEEEEEEQEDDRRRRAEAQERHAYQAAAAALARAHEAELEDVLDELAEAKEDADHLREEVAAAAAAAGQFYMDILALRVALRESAAAEGAAATAAAAEAAGRRVVDAGYGDTAKVRALREAVGDLAADLADVARSRASALRALEEARHTLAAAAAERDALQKTAQALRTALAVATAGGDDGGLSPAGAMLANVLSAETAALLVAFLRDHLGLEDVHDRLPRTFRTAAVRPTRWAAARVGPAPAPNDGARRAALSALRTAVAARYAVLAASGDIGRAELCCAVEEELDDIEIAFCA